MDVGRQIDNEAWLNYTAETASTILTVAIAARSQSTFRSGVLLSNQSYLIADYGQTTLIDSATHPSPFRLPDSREAVFAHVLTLKREKFG